MTFVILEASKHKGIMLVTKQLSEDEFVVRMNEEDLWNEDTFIIAHDYVRFFSNSGIMTASEFEGKPYGKYAGVASNRIKARQKATIDIRDFIKIVLPRLTENENCQESHLVRDGQQVYTYSSSKIMFYENGVQKIALRKTGQPDYTIIDAEVYRAIKNGEM